MRSDTPGGDRHTLEALDVAVYRIPTDRPEADGTLSWDQTTVVTVKVTAGSATGLGWTYGSDACAGVIEQTLAPEVVGHNAMDVASCHARMSAAVRNLGRPGLVAMAMSAVDIALWDLKARALSVSLSALFGRVKDGIPVYGSGGFTTYDEDTTARQLEGWVAEDGVSAVKIKIGEGWGSRPERDLSRVGLARKVIGDGVGLFVDANGGYAAKQAVRLGREMGGRFEVSWFEEPVSSDDLDGLALVRSGVDADVTAGEYGFDLWYFERMLAARAVDCLQIDVTRCGGYTTWLRTAALAEGRNLDVSAHCAPSLHAHVAVAVPNCRHIEMFHDHRRVDAILFDCCLEPRAGDLCPDSETPGHGMSIKAEDADRYRIA